MESSAKSSTWRRILIAICSLIAIVCTIVCFYIRDIVNYTDEYDYDTRREYEEEWNGESHIGKISRYDEDGNELNRNWGHFGGQDWYSNEITGGLGTNEDFGELVRLYSYEKNGEDVSLWVYDITNKLKGKTTIDEFYKFLQNDYCNDTTTLWKITDEIPSLRAMTTGPTATIRFNSDEAKTVFKESFVVFANDRIYSFHFSNNGLESNGKNLFNLFHKRCLKIVKSVDFNSYRQWNIGHTKLKELVLKENSERMLLCRLVILIASISGLVIFCLAITHRLVTNNRRAKILFLYWAICFIIILAFCSLYPFFVEEYANDAIILPLTVLLTTIIYAPIASFLYKRSSQKYVDTYLIPDWCVNTFGLASIFQKRLLIVFLFIPLFYACPIPVVGWFVFAFYVIPVSIIALLILGLLWIKDGKKNNYNCRIKMDRMFCRHCGKLIDGDSEFCRYCGKRL